MFEPLEEAGYVSAGFLPDSLFSWREGEIKQVIEPSPPAFQTCFIGLHLLTIADNFKVVFSFLASFLYHQSVLKAYWSVRLDSGGIVSGNV